MLILEWTIFIQEINWKVCQSNLICQGLVKECTNCVWEGAYVITGQFLPVFLMALYILSVATYGL
jgi:hypothetical protein